MRRTTTSHVEQAAMTKQDPYPPGRCSRLQPPGDRRHARPDAAGRDHASQHCPHPGNCGKHTREPTKGITGLVYRSIQGTTRLVGSGIDALLGQLMPLLDQRADSHPRARAKPLLAALNGVLGDHLAASANPLAIPMQLRRDGQPLVLTKQDLAASIPARRPARFCFWCMGCA